MAWLGLVLGLPFLLLILLPLLRPWTDRMGWTRIRGKERAMLSTALQGWNLAFFTEWYSAAEYQKACHDEEDHTGRKRRPHFPGISDGEVSIRPVRDTPADLVPLAQWLGCDPSEVWHQLPEQSVAALVQVAGRPIGYVQFGKAGELDWCIERLLGDEEARSASVVQLLTAYLIQFEGASTLLTPPDLVTDRAALPEFHLLL